MILLIRGGIKSCNVSQLDGMKDGIDVSIVTSSLLKSSALSLKKKKRRACVFSKLFWDE